MEPVDLAEARQHLAALLERAARGEDVVIVRGDGAAFRLVPSAAPAGQRVAGLHAGACRMAEDFDAALPDGFWLGEA